MTSTTSTTTDATSISKKNVSEKNTSDDTTTSQPTTSTECKDSTPTGPTVQQLLDLVKELKNVSKMSTSTDSPSTTKTCKEEQKPPAVRTPETITGTTTVTKADFENFKREILTISTQNSERFQPPTQSMPGKYSKKKRNFSETIILILPIFFYVRTGSIISYQKNIHSPYNKYPFHDVRSPYTYPYHSYVPHLAPLNPTAPPVPITPTSLPHVNEALSRVERDIQGLHNSLSHPHTLNNEHSYQRSVQISKQVENLTSMVGTLKEKMKCYEKNRYTATPTVRSPLISHDNMIQRGNLNRPANPYLKKKHSPPKNSVTPTINLPKVPKYPNDNSADYYDPVLSQDIDDRIRRRMTEK